MIKQFLKLTSLVALGFVAPIANAGQFVTELNAPLKAISDDLLSSHKLELDQSFSAGEDSYAVFAANDKVSLMSFFQRAEIHVEKVAEVLFINTPTLSGGQPAAEEPRIGHQVYIIERPIPGVGFFGLDKKKKISRGSNNAIAKLGEIIEWDQSYLTSEGTYCVYRADSPETLREHGALAGAPVGKITAVDQTKF